MQISARNALALAALAAVAHSAAAYEPALDVAEDVVDAASDALTGFFGYLNSFVNSIVDWTSFA